MKIKHYYFGEDTCNAQLTKIDLNNSRVECVCKGKSNFSSYKEENFQKYQKFSQNCKDSYMQYFKCYKNVFNKNLFKNNIGNYVILTFILVQTGSLLLFNFVSKKPMMSHINDVLMKRAKKNYEKESMSSRSGSYSQSGSESGSYSRSGSRSGSESGSRRSDSRSGSNSRSGSVSKSRSESKSGSSKNDSFSYSSKNSKKNPPKKKKTKYAFVSIDNKEKANNNENNIYYMNNNSGENNIDNNNKVLSKTINNDQNINNNEEETNNNNINNTNAPNTISQIYAKRYLSNRNDYVDNSYREDSYNFDIPKQKKKKGDDSEEEEEEEEEDNQNENQNGGNNEEGKDNNNGNNNGNGTGNKKPKKGKKTEELPPAAAPIKTDLEKFKDEAKKYIKFSFFELYWFIIRKKQRIISLFFKKDIYDIFVVKLSLLILSYTLDIFITTLCFFESEISKLFRNKKHIDPAYVIFMGIFIILISTIIMRIVDYLMEYRMEFKKYEILQKYENDQSNYFNSLNNIIKGFKKKMMIYFIINFAFSLFVWYTVSAFFGTYSNTRLIWGIMIGINVAISNIFPFIYYLIAVILQYKGIHKGDFKMYQIGMIMIKI